MAEQRNRRKKSRGHGCLGFGIVLAVLSAALFCVLFFMTDIFNAPKYRLYGLFYQRQYSSEVEAASKEFGVDENLIYAVIRTESGFREDAESHAGAVGLMQLMPDTFTWLQGNLDGEVIYSESDLKNPAINIRYGTYYLAYLTALYGNESTAVAAYNAGAANVDKWLSDVRYSQDGTTLTDIPYKETKQYVQKVEDAKKIYEKIP